MELPSICVPLQCSNHEALHDLCAEVWEAEEVHTRAHSTLVQNSLKAPNLLHEMIIQVQTCCMKFYQWHEQS